MTNWIASLIHWVSAHPHLTGLIVGVIACSEALAFIGLLVPGAALMLAAGALIGAGAVDFWSIFAWAVGGAIVGDGLSYWIGHHYRERLQSLKILRRHPQWLERGTAFFQQHGGKSILLARFVGPVRPVIPVVAGMLGMSPLRFYLNNILSALAWAPAHLLAGMVVGASLVIAGQVATRLAIVLATLLIAVWLIIWLVRFIYTQIQPHVIDWFIRLANSKWIAASPRVQGLFADLYDPKRPPARALIIWLGLLVAAMWLFLGVAEDVLNHDPLVYAGQAIYHFLQQLRTPIGDMIMVGITEVGDVSVTLPLAVAVFGYLLWRRAWRDGFYWLFALGFGLISVTIIKLVLKIPRPVSLYSGSELYSFPSGHATMSTVIYGLLAVYIASSLRSQRRWYVYAIAALLILAIAFSRLYLGAHWLADVTAGVALGTIGVSLISIARERHHPDSELGFGLIAVTVCVFLSAAAWHITGHFDNDLKRYSIRHPITLISESDWLAHSCDKLPTWRVDLRGEQEQPLNIQWAGKLNSIQQTLLSYGWRKPLTLSMRTALSWLLPQPSLSQLPVLPQLHDGQNESLVLVYQGDQQKKLDSELILRLWPTALRLEHGGPPIWVGTVASQHLMQLPLISFARLSHDFDKAQTEMRLNLNNRIWATSQCSNAGDEKDSQWNGRVILMYDEK
ncbi:MAG: phosphatase PAP2 family protein [Gammaproteobacteria bacterium]|nr:phosphatase PAP2 family protein [Gammaproteobacteria bacterium]